MAGQPITCSIATQTVHAGSTISLTTESDLSSVSLALIQDLSSSRSLHASSQATNQHTAQRTLSNVGHTTNHRSLETGANQPRVDSANTYRLDATHHLSHQTHTIQSKPKFLFTKGRHLTDFNRQRVRAGPIASASVVSAPGLPNHMSFRECHSKLPIVKLKECDGGVAPTADGTPARRSHTIADFNNLRHSYKNSSHYKRYKGGVKGQGDLSSSHCINDALILRAVSQTSLTSSGARTRPNTAQNPCSLSAAAPAPAAASTKTTGEVHAGSADSTASMTSYQLKGNSLCKSSTLKLPIDQLPKVLLAENMDPRRSQNGTTENQSAVDKPSEHQRLVVRYNKTSDNNSFETRPKSGRDKNEKARRMPLPRKVTFMREEGKPQPPLPCYNIPPNIHIPAKNEHLQVTASPSPLMLSERNLEMFNKLHASSEVNAVGNPQVARSSCSSESVKQRILNWVKERHTEGESHGSPSVLRIPVVEEEQTTCHESQNDAGN